MDTSNRASTQYSELGGIFTPMGYKVEGLIQELLTQSELSVHRVSHRIKAEGSADAKIRRKPDTYQHLEDLHDFLGIRIISFKAGEVQPIVSLLRSEFVVDETRSKDRSEELDPEQFGYLSSHLILKISDDRSKLREWEPYKGRYFEVQIRSILQHAWAEIEHDLGYKSAIAIPNQLRRRFARLAGLLEIADSEFDSLTEQIRAHVQNATTIVESGADMPLDRDSLGALLRSSDVLFRIDREIAERTNTVLSEVIDFEVAAREVPRLKSLGFERITQVTAALEPLGDDLANFAALWNKSFPEEESHGQYSRGICLFYLFLHVGLNLEEDARSLRAILKWDDEVFLKLREAHARANLAGRPAL